VIERRCSECGGPLGPHAQSNRKTCSGPCRSKRSRRLKAAKQRAGKARAHPEELQPLYQADKGSIQDAAMEVMREEVRPVVREALTQDVLLAIQDLVNLTPTIVEKIKDDLEQDKDPTLRQRAYTLVAKYTLGNASVAPPPPEQAAQGLTVNFMMPRPGDETSTTEDPQEHGEAVELRTCTECKEDHPDSAFVAGSDRCTTCHEALQAKVAERFGD
jgi:hypothetical protein